MTETPAQKNRIIIDTNTWVQAALADLSPETANDRQNSSRRMVKYARAHFDVVFSVPTMLELGRVLADPNGITNELAAINRQRREGGLAPLRFLARQAYVDELQRSLKPYRPGKSPTICEGDRFDQMFLDLAYGTETHLLVSWDRYLHDVNAPWLLVMTPHTFCTDILRKEGSPELGSLAPFVKSMDTIRKAVQAAERRARKNATPPQPKAAEPAPPPSEMSPVLFSEPRGKRVRSSFSELGTATSNEILQGGGSRGSFAEQLRVKLTLG